MSPLAPYMSAVRLSGLGPWAGSFLAVLSQAIRKAARHSCVRTQVLINNINTWIHYCFEWLLSFFPIVCFLLQFPKQRTWEGSNSSRSQRNCNQAQFHSSASSESEATWCFLMFGDCSSHRYANTSWWKLKSLSIGGQQLPTSALVGTEPSYWQLREEEPSLETLVFSTKTRRVLQNAWWISQGTVLRR